MTALNKKALKQQIHHEITKLEDDVNSLEEKVKPVPPDTAIGRLSRMEALNEKSVNEAALVVVKNRLRLLKRAQERIDDEDFGSCENCGEPIPTARLQLLPEARHCVKCAEKVEH